MKTIDYIVYESQTFPACYASQAEEDAGEAEVNALYLKNAAPIRLNLLGVL